MGVKVRERGGAWWLFIDHQGKRKAKRVGPGRQGKKAAELAAIQVRAKLATGDLSILSPATGTQLTTFADYAQRWLSEAITPHRKARTEDYYRQMLKNHLHRAFGKMPLADLSPLMSGDSSRANSRGERVAIRSRTWPRRCGRCSTRPKSMS